jgi:hypothetical protein
MHRGYPRAYGLPRPPKPSRGYSPQIGARFLSNLLSGNTEAAERFLVDWYGDRPESGASAVPSGLDAPPALRRLYELLARWPEAIVQNHVLTPPEDADDRLVFSVENQGVYEWATALGGDADATVWGREPGTTSWVQEEPRLSGFLIELLVFEAVMGSAHGATVAWLPSGRLPDVVRPLQPLPFGSWRWPDYPTTFYAGSDRQLAVVAPNRTPADPGDDVSVFVAARDAHALAFLDDVVDDAWEHFSRRESG